VATEKHCESSPLFYGNHKSNETKRGDSLSPYLSLSFFSSRFSETRAVEALSSNDEVVEVRRRCTDEGVACAPVEVEVVTCTRVVVEVICTHRVS
jgi:hypothetical protein